VRLGVAHETLLVIWEKATLSDAIHEQLQNSLCFWSERLHTNGAQLTVILSLRFTASSLQGPHPLEQADSASLCRALTTL